MIEVTEKASIEIEKLIKEQGQEGQHLRMGVKGGGCSGLSYNLSFDIEREGDKISEINGVKILCDVKSYIYLNGMTLDFVETLMERGFKFINPNATKTCGCGTSFSV